MDCAKYFLYIYQLFIYFIFYSLCFSHFENRFDVLIFLILILFLLALFHWFWLLQPLRLRGYKWAS